MKIEKHQYIKLLEYAVSQKSSYSMNLGLLKANMVESEFDSVRDIFFMNGNRGSHPIPLSEIHDWRLRPEAIFGYLSFKQYEHSFKSSQRALWIAIGSLVISFFTAIKGLL